jgi:hypothetical protein
MDTTPDADQVGGLFGVRSVEVPRELREVPPSSATILKAEASMHTELAQLRASLHAQMEATIVRRALELQARIDVVRVACMPFVSECQQLLWTLSVASRVRRARSRTSHGSGREWSPLLRLSRHARLVAEDPVWQSDGIVPST